MDLLNQTADAFKEKALVLQKFLFFSSILHDTIGFEQSLQRKSLYDDCCKSSPAISNETMRMFVQQPFLLTWRRYLLKNSKGEIHPLVLNKTLKLVARMASGVEYKRKGSHGRLPTLSLNQENQVLTRIMNRSGVNGLARVLKVKLIHFVVI